ncbi:MAG: acyltransferase family protein [Myxococcales bacterium]|nr:acyltransferase family protein [Myxococcales bacterium]
MSAAVAPALALAQANAVAVGGSRDSVANPIFDQLFRWQQVGEQLAGQLAHWAEPERRRSLLNRAVSEVGEASEEIASLLLSGSWRAPPEEIERRFRLLMASKNLSEYGIDPFGFAPESVRGFIPVLEFLYRVWFRAEAHNIGRVPDGRCLIIANHSGQLPFDGAVIGASLLLEREPPRMVRSMVEKFATALPFFGTFCNRCGQVTGLPDNCRRLLEADEAVLVFPEGARGIAKPFSERYRMTAFGHGFMRLALETNSPIVPVAVVGAEEQTINMFDATLLAKLVGAPSLPVTPLMLLLGPLAMLPAPVKYRVYYGEPMRFDGDPNDDDAVIATKVAEVKQAIATMIERGLAERKGIFV